MTWNPGNIEPEKGASFDILPEGKYRFTVVNAEPKTWPSGDIYWNLELEAIEPASSARGWFKLNFPSPDGSEKQNKRIARALWSMRALGMDPTKQPVEPGTDMHKVIGKTCVAQVEHDQYTDKKTGLKKMAIRIWDLDPDTGPGSVQPKKEISEEEADATLPF